MSLGVIRKIGVSGVVGDDGTMIDSGGKAKDSLGTTYCVEVAERLLEFLVDIVDCLLRWVNQIGRIEAIVAQFVEHYFEGGEVGCISYSESVVAVKVGIYCGKQMSLAQSVVVRSFGEMPDRADSGDNVDVAVNVANCVAH